jgi:hypothetical protein
LQTAKLFFEKISGEQRQIHLHPVTIIVTYPMPHLR